MIDISQSLTIERPQEISDQNDRDSGITVTISQDNMAAYIAFAPQSSGEDAVTVEAALHQLEEAGVIFGIELDAVERAIRESLPPQDHPTPPKTYQVAWGKHPINGEDARIDYHEALKGASGRPKVLEDGRVNLFDLNTVRNVPKGTVLAVQTPPTQGEPGATVVGAKIQPRPGRDLWLRAGRGTALSEDRLSVIAEVDGHAAVIDGKVEVTSIFIVPRDVGVETGNIQFVGSVVVRGNVHQGFTVKAEGDVEIQGSIDGGTVEAQGNVTVQYGIKGGGRGRVVAGGVVKARFIENADVRAGSHIWATDGILQSRVESGLSVEVLGKRGAIIGGRVMAKDSVSARFLGSAIGGATEISVGALPSLRAELLEKRKKQAELESNLERAALTLQYLSDHERKGLLTRDKREMKSRLVQMQEQLFANLKDIKNHSQELEQAINDSRKSWVQAKDVCYSGVKLGIGSASYINTSSLQRCRFCLNGDGEVEIVMIPNR